MSERTVAFARVGAAAAVARQSAELAREIRAALAVAPPADLHEVVLQSYLFIGFPRAINALAALRRELGEDEPPPPPPDEPSSLDRWRERGEELCRRIYGSGYERLRSNMRALHPSIGEWMVLEGYGKVLSRPYLGVVERECAILGILAADGQWAQLESHLHGALRVGAAPGEVAEVVGAVADLGIGLPPERPAELLRKVFDARGLSGP